VVHTHAPSLIPFGVTNVPAAADVPSLGPHRLRHSPFFEIRERAGMTDMLIRNAMLGRNLADALAIIRPL